jgi:hypothetical protein
VQRWSRSGHFETGFAGQIEPDPAVILSGLSIYFIGRRPLNKIFTRIFSKT